MWSWAHKQAGICIHCSEFSLRLILMRMLSPLWRGVRFKESSVSKDWVKFRCDQEKDMSARGEGSTLQWHARFERLLTVHVWGTLSINFFTYLNSGWAHVFISSVVNSNRRENSSESSSWNGQSCWAAENFRFGSCRCGFSTHRVRSFGHVCVLVILLMLSC